MHSRFVHIRQSIRENTDDGFMGGGDIPCIRVIVSFRLSSPKDMIRWHQNERNRCMTLQADPITPSTPDSPSAYDLQRCRNATVRKWIEKMAAMCRPDKIVFCDGTKQERDRFYEQ